MSFAQIEREQFSLSNSHVKDKNPMEKLRSPTDPKKCRNPNEFGISLFPPHLYCFRSRHIQKILAFIVFCRR